MDDEIEESTLIRDGSDSDPERVLETDTNVFQVFTEEENAVSVAEIASNGDDNCKRNQSDAEQHLKFRETSGRETDIKSPGIVESKDEIKNKDVLREKEDTTMTFIMPDKNPYDKAMGYLHTHSLPSLFQVRNKNE